MISKMRFPINFEKLRGIPINRHPGAFGCQRKYDIHTGVDLYLDEGDLIYAIEPGVVVKKGIFTGDETTKWWYETHALSVKGESGIFVYGEVSKQSIEHLNVGDEIKTGQLVGKCAKVLPRSKIRTDIQDHSNCMLHLELLKPEWDGKEWITIEHYYDDKYNLLIDPTDILIKILNEKHRHPKLLI